jgi:hypothetical protein
MGGSIRAFLWLLRTAQACSHIFAQLLSYGFCDLEFTQIPINDIGISAKNFSILPPLKEGTTQGFFPSCCSGSACRNTLYK